jgi:isoquinoline 1-oxidoreductase subunit beta
MITHAPAFGMKLKSVDDTSARKLPGIKDIFIIKSLEDDYEKQFFDPVTFTDLVVVVGNTTWEVLNAKKALRVEWEPFPEHMGSRNSSGKSQTIKIPAGLESTTSHISQMAEMVTKPATIYELQ